MAEKGYSYWGDRQIHWRIYAPEGQPAAPYLYCFHPAPYSGLAFQNIAPLLAADRRVIAPDFPGYGQSDGLGLTPSIDDYTHAMQAVIEALTPNKPFDTLGFHTGCFVAAEIARQMPSRVRATCLLDVPAFDAQKSAELAASDGGPFEISDQIDCLGKAWHRGFKARKAVQGEDQAFAMFVEHLRPGRGMNAAFYAAFTYPWEERLREINTPVMVLVTTGFLSQSTLAAAAALPAATRVDRSDIKASVLDGAGASISQDVLQFLKLQAT
jgi:pimeloyl-ACP methyl ester carboxylesterase